MPMTNVLILYVPVRSGVLFGSSVLSLFYTPSAALATAVACRPSRERERPELPEAHRRACALGLGTMMDTLMRGALDMALAENERAGATSRVDVKKWWGSATSKAPEEAYKRLIEACRLAVEEAYTTGMDVIGGYAEQAGQMPGEGMRFFRRFVSTCQRLKLMPAWWTTQHMRRCEQLASNNTGDYYLLHAVEVSDVRQKWGFEMTNLLRALAHKVYQRYVDDDDGLSASCDDELEESEDDAPPERCEPRPLTAAPPLQGLPPQQAPAPAGLRQCSGCGQELVASHFTKSQWKNNACKRQCKGCQGDPLYASTPDQAAAPKPGRASVPKAAAKDTTADGFATLSLVDHLLAFDGDGGAGGRLGVLIDHYVRAVGASLGMPAARVRSAQLALKEQAEAGQPNALYLYGKILHDARVVVLGQRPTQQTAAAKKLWAAAAKAGHAYACALLGKVRNEEGATAEALGWWRKAIEIAALPEAAYNLGVAYGLGHNGTPVHYTKAATYYAHAADIDLREPTGKPEARRVHEQVLDMIGPNNEEQSNFQLLARRNLAVVQRKIGTVLDAPRSGFDAEPANCRTQ